METRVRIPRLAAIAKITVVETIVNRQQFFQFDFVIVFAGGAKPRSFTAVPL